MRDFSPNHRRLLERFAPVLHYDPQDAFRATSAATMTDNPPNALRRNGGAPLSVAPALSLATLAEHADEQLFAPGDHLDAGPDPIGDARRMQADPRYPHRAYGRVLEGRHGALWLQYWLWYYDNPKTFLQRGRHEGDWELVQVGLGPDELPRTVTCSQHGLGETRDWEHVARALDEPQRPLVYVAPFSHAGYFEPKTKFYFPAADHPTDRGPALVPEIAPFGAWERWRGRWGADVGILGGWLKALGGASPGAPIAQRQRWAEPAAYCERARRPTTSRLKALLWRMGRRTYPLSPEIASVELAGATLTVRYRRRQRPLRRTRHLLITVHEADSPSHMLAHRPVRWAWRRRSVTVELPGPEELPGPAECVVWASSFNGLGQRSDPVGPFRSTAP